MDQSLHGEIQAVLQRLRDYRKRRWSRTAAWLSLALLVGFLTAAALGMVFWLIDMGAAIHPNAAADIDVLATVESDQAVPASTEFSSIAHDLTLTGMACNAGQTIASAYCPSAGTESCSACSAPHPSTLGSSHRTDESRATTAEAQSTAAAARTTAAEARTTASEARTTAAGPAGPCSRVADAEKAGGRSVPPAAVASPSPALSGAFKAPVISTQVEGCSSVGRNILFEGGSAVDAAIAVHVCANIYEPQHAGIGGGFFMLVYDEKNKVNKIINAREKAPASAKGEDYEFNRQRALKGVHSVAVPGEVAGYLEAWKQFGRLPWCRLFTQTILRCEEGVPASASLSNVERATRLADPSWPYEDFREDFYGSERQISRGKILYRPRLCKTLRRIADYPESFYSGDLAEDILRDIRDRGGNWRATDLASYTISVQNALPFFLSKINVTVLTAPPPSLGAVLGITLAIMDVFRRGSSINDATYHTFAEALKTGFAFKMNVGDPRHLPQLITYAEVHGDVTIAEMRTMTDRPRDPSTYYTPRPPRPPEVAVESGDIGGVHTSVADQFGLVVAMSSSIGARFGGKVMGNRTGIIFNNAMADFSITRTPAYNKQLNWVNAGARPVSALVPTVIVDQQGKVIFVGGATGGYSGISALAWVILQNVTFHESLRSAVERPRIHNQLIPDMLLGEQNILHRTWMHLTNYLGHRGSLTAPYYMGYVNALARRSTSDWLAQADVRTGGAVAGREL